MKYLISLVLIGALATGGAAAAEPDAIIFPHDLHFEAGVDCATCHGDLTAAAAEARSLRPEMATCGECHDVDDDKNCGLCHANVDEAGDYPRRSYGAARFAHGPHLDRGLDCAVCHGAAAAARPTIPAKPDCRKCHETADDYADCGLCHAPGFVLRPAGHGPDWMSHHGAEARFDDMACAQCHSQTTCQECHAGDNVRPRSHALNYAFNHALDARGNAMDCATCHAEPRFCSDCHAAQHILPSDHSAAGWLSLSGGGRHASEGLFDIESCIACHDAGSQDPTCARCHGR